MLYSIVSLLLAVVATWAILSPNVDDGIIIKFGLCLIAIGAYGSSSLLVRPSESAHVMILFGILICIAGTALKARRRCINAAHTTAPGK